MSATFNKRSQNKIDYKQLEISVKRYKNSNPSTETRSCVIDLTALKDLIAYCDANPSFQAIRIYFFRPEASGISKLAPNVNPPHGFNEMNKGTLQMGIAMVPVSNYKVTDRHKFSADDAKDPSEQDIIYGIIPGLTNEGSGMCPNNCSGSIGGQ